MAGTGTRRGKPRRLYYQMMVSPRIGGAAKLAMEIHEHAQSARGDVSELLLPGGGEAEATANERGYPYVPYSLDRLTSANRLHAAAENLHLLLKTNGQRKGLVHVHAPFVYGSAALYFRLASLRTVLHIHLDFTADDLRWSLRSPPDLILICAQYMTPAVEDALPDAAGKVPRIRVVPNAVDLQRFFPTDRAEAKAGFDQEPSRPLLLMAANLAPHKGQATAVRAVRSLKEIGHNVDLWLVGEERDETQNFRRQLIELSESLDVADRVRFLGFRRDVPELLRAADFVLLPSTSEGLPLVLLEAQASKAVVLAAPTAGVPEIVADDRTGFLIPADDHRAYAQQISWLLANDEHKNAIANRAYQQVCEHNDLGRYCERILSEYDGLLDA